MKNLWISVKITLAMCLLLGVGYVLVLRGVSALAGPNGGQAETLTLDGRVVGAANVGQQFTGGRYFWGRPSAVDYNGGGSGGSNKATTNPEYLADVEQRVQDFLALIRRLAVERNAGNNVDILAETKVFEDLLGENRRLSGCNGNADVGRL